MTSLSFGAGVNSTALLILKHQGKLDFDQVIFADPMNERPETYEYLEKIIVPFCETYHIPFHIVSKGDLFDFYYERQIIPFRFMRQCTDKFKIRPIKKLMKKLDSTTTILGIDYGEKHRAYRIEKRNDRTVLFPLIDLKLDRDGCKALIEDFGWDPPVKSGCWFCPFQRKQQWINLLRDLENYS